MVCKCNDDIFFCFMVAVKALVGVTKKSASGGLHTKFRSSSSSSSSGSEETSSGSSSDSDSKATPRKDNNDKKAPPTTSQWDVKARGAVVPTKNTVAGSNLDGVLGTTPTGSVGRGAVGGTRGRGGGARGARGRGRNRRRKPPGDIVVGGPKDVLTTKSTLYTNPSTVGGSFRDLAAPDSTNSNQTAAPSAGVEGEMVVAASGGEAAKNEAVVSADDEQASIEIMRNYSSCPELQGPPRVGDTLAFKVCKCVLTVKLVPLRDLGPHIIQGSLYTCNSQTLRFLAFF